MVYKHVLEKDAVHFNVEIYSSHSLQFPYNGCITDKTAAVNGLFTHLGRFKHLNEPHCTSHRVKNVYGKLQSECYKQNKTNLHRRELPTMQ